MTDYERNAAINLMIPPLMCNELDTNFSSWHRMDFRPYQLQAISMTDHRLPEFNPIDDLLTALRRIWPQTFSHPFNEYQGNLIRKIESVIVAGGHEVTTGERAGGNTAILGCSAIWSVLRGHHRFAMFVHGSPTMLSWVRHHADVARAAMPGMGPTTLPSDPRCIIRFGTDQAIAVVPNMTGHQHVGLPSLLLVDGYAPNQFKKWTEAKSPRSAFMIQTKTAVGPSLKSG